MGSWPPTTCLRCWMRVLYLVHRRRSPEDKHYRSVPIHCHLRSPRQLGNMASDGPVVLNQLTCSTIVAHTNLSEELVCVYNAVPGFPAFREDCTITFRELKVIGDQSAPHAFSVTLCLCQYARHRFCRVALHHPNCLCILSWICMLDVDLTQNPNHLHGWRRALLKMTWCLLSWCILLSRSCLYSCDQYGIRSWLCCNQNQDVLNGSIYTFVRLDGSPDWTWHWDFSSVSIKRVSSRLLRQVVTIGCACFYASHNARKF